MGRKTIMKRRTVLQLPAIAILPQFSAPETTTRSGPMPMYPLLQTVIPWRGDKVAPKDNTITQYSHPAIGSERIEWSGAYWGEVTDKGFKIKGKTDYDLSVWDPADRGTADTPPRWLKLKPGKRFTRYQHRMVRDRSTPLTTVRQRFPHLGT